MIKSKVAAEQIKTLAEKADRNDVIIFKAIVSLSISENIITENELAIEFELGGLVSIWTIRNNNAHPHPRIRGRVYKYIIKECEHLCRQ